MDILSAIHFWSEWAPERVAHACRDERLTYRQLRARAGALASYLHVVVPRGAPIAVYGHKQTDLVACFLACLEAGHPYVPIDAGTPSASAATLCIICPIGSTGRSKGVPVTLGNAPTEPSVTRPT